MPQLAIQPHGGHDVASHEVVGRRGASQTTTSATSSGAATWWCSRRAATNARTPSSTQPVSVTGGWTTLTAMPSAASSLAAVSA